MNIKERLSAVRQHGDPLGLRALGLAFQLKTQTEINRIWSLESYPMSQKQELLRLRWRQWVMMHKGGPGWLLERMKIANFQEKNIGPHLLRFPDEVWFVQVPTDRR